MKRPSWLLLSPLLGCATAADPAEAPLPSQCDAPLAAVAYEEVGAAWGLPETADTYPERREDAAVAFVDLDGDGDDDVIAAPRRQGLKLIWNEGDRFDVVDLAAEVGTVVAIGAADIDGDGVLEVFLGNLGGQMQVRRLEGGSLVDQTTRWGVPNAAFEASVRHFAFGDYDADGDLDVYVTVGEAGADERPDRLFRNDGERLADVSHLLPADTGLGWSSVWFDYDDDGDLDIYTANAEPQFGGPSRLLRNDGPGTGAWLFTDVPQEQCFCAEVGNVMGVSAADFDGDLDLDLWLSAHGPAVMLRNDGDGLFTDVTAAWNAAAVDHPEEMTFGGLAFDHDNDGRLDLLATTGPFWWEPLPTQPADQPDVLLRNTGSGFVDVAAQLGLDDTGAGRGVAAGQLDDDGFLDLVVMNAGGTSKVHRARCTKNRALLIDLAGPGANRFGVGAKLLLDLSDGRTLRRDVTAEAGFASTVHPRAHFGLGEAWPERLRVRWPTGEEQEVELGRDAPLRLTVAFEE